MEAVTKASCERAASASENARRRAIAATQRSFRDFSKAELTAFLANARQWFDEDGRWDAEKVRTSGKARDILGAASRLAGNVSASLLDHVTKARRETFIDAAARAGKSVNDDEDRAVAKAAMPDLREADDGPQRDDSGRRIVARVVIMEPDGRFWIVREEPGPHQDWPDVKAEHADATVKDMLPGGGVEDTETDQEAAVREAMEETGLLVELTHYVCDLDDVYTKRRFFLGRRIGGEPTSVDADENRPVSVRLAGLDDVEFSSAYDRIAVQQAQAGHLRPLDGQR